MSSEAWITCVFIVSVTCLWGYCLKLNYEIEVVKIAASCGSVK